MKKLLLLACLLCTGIACTPREQLNTLPVENFESVQAFFRYRGPGHFPIISGHRGCRENGMPENSIAAFEYTLRNLPAMFEIDPRITSDSVIVLMHDPTLDRTSTGSGRVDEHTWAQLQQLYLKDVDGNVTEEKIPTLDKVIAWSAGKTVINLDVYTPMELMGAALQKHGFPPQVMLTIHTPEQLRYFYGLSQRTMFSVHINSLERLELFEQAGAPWENILVYVGARIKPENAELYRRLHDKGVSFFISTAGSHDQLKDRVQRLGGYASELDTTGKPALPDAIESDFPIELYETLKQVKR